MHLINADLHSHSHVSDGTLSPAALAERARAQGVELWSLTDHDEIGGQQGARDAALALGMDYLTGTEISVSFAGETVHIVGLGFDAGDAALRAGLAATRSGRRDRARQMAAGLAQAGIGGAFEGALRYVGNPDLISRTHFARFLVDSGVCPIRTPSSAAISRPATPATCRTSGPAWARPCAGSATPAAWRSSRTRRATASTPTEEYALITEFIAHGGLGMEVVTGSHSIASRPATPKRRSNSTCWPRAAATSTRPRRAAPNSARCPTCPGG